MGVGPPGDVEIGERERDQPKEDLPGVDDDEEERADEIEQAEAKGLGGHTELHGAMGRGEETWGGEGLGRSAARLHWRTNHCGDAALMQTAAGADAGEGHEDDTKPDDGAGGQGDGGVDGDVEPRIGALQGLGGGGGGVVRRW
eukprot:scaffold13836_cov73-Isochrysis_galbana.AAC.1